MRKLFQRYCQGKILEVGSGPSNPTSDYLSTLGELHGVDIDPALLTNSALKAAHVISKRFPFPDSTFDACASDYTGEHLVDPRLHLTEIRRILKPGGHYVFRTPNRFHYTAVVSRLTPHWVHVKLANRLRGITGHDPYPTYYRLNSRRQVMKLATQTGFKVEYFRAVEREPSYGMSSRILFLTFTAYERLVNCSDFVSGTTS